MTTTTTEPARTPARGRVVQLAHYTANGQRRILIGHRVDGLPRVSDTPADGHGHTYVVETDFNSTGELDALIDDYLQQAALADAIPMAHTILDLADDLPDAPTAPNAAPRTDPLEATSRTEIA
jgi:alpha-D-ribose 1-methylphosphonate 5-triphosphate synthase subunit PhnG